MRRRIAAAAAVLVAAVVAAGYVRTADRQTGVELFWATPIVTYHVNPARAGTSPSCAPVGSSDRALEVVRASFSAWEQSCTNLRLVYGGPTSEIATGMGGSGENVVVFRRGWCSEDPVARDDGCMDDPEVDCGTLYGCFEDATLEDRKILALTSVLYDPNSGRIVDADIEVNDWDGRGAGEAITGNNGGPAHGWYFTCDRQQDWGACGTYGQDRCYYMDLQATVTHEAGHFFGLGHSPLQSATMFATARLGDLEMRSLSSDDVAGVCAIYPQPDGDGGCGCGSAGAGGLVPLLVAALALRRRPITRR